MKSKRSPDSSDDSIDLKTPSWFTNAVTTIGHALWRKEVLLCYSLTTNVILVAIALSDRSESFGADSLLIHLTLSVGFYGIAIFVQDVLGGLRYGERAHVCGSMCYIAIDGLTLYTVTISTMDSPEVLPVVMFVVFILCSTTVVVSMNKLNTTGLLMEYNMTGPNITEMLSYATRIFLLLLLGTCAYMTAATTVLFGLREGQRLFWFHYLVRLGMIWCDIIYTMNFLKYKVQELMPLEGDEGMHKRVFENHRINCRNIWKAAKIALTLLMIAALAVFDTEYYHLIPSIMAACAYLKIVLSDGLCGSNSLLGYKVEPVYSIVGVPEKVKGDVCNICFSDTMRFNSNNGNEKFSGRDAVALGCTHKFHFRCIDKWAVSVSGKGIHAPFVVKGSPEMSKRVMGDSNLIIQTAI